MTERQIRVYQNLMGENAQWAEATRELLRRHNVKMLNLIGSPGSGKTTLLENMVDQLRGQLDFAVLEGDVETTKDAERLDALNVVVSQLLTNGACHLSAKLVHHALRDLPLDQLDIVFVENVGNLVCPAEFDIGEHGKIAVLSCTEGEDKPAKYPMLFRESVAAVVTKTDLLPYIPFDLAACRNYIRQVNGTLPVFEVSAPKHNGLDGWIEWLRTFARTP
jgi:hydrogenase nickel incorporation protein HypB